MTLADIESLRPGQMLEVPASALSSVDLVQSIGTEHQADLACGQLGMFDGERVLKLTEAVPQPVQENLRRQLKLDDP